MTRANHLVHIGIKGSVVALDRRTGGEVWRTPLKGSQFVNVALDGDVLLAATRGEIFALDPKTGRIMWANPLKGLGLGLVSMTAPGQTTAMQQQLLNDAAAAAAAASAAT